MRFTRWWNPSLPQTLLVSVMLLYVDAAFSLTSLIGLGIGSSSYAYTPWLFSGYSSLHQVSTVSHLAVLAGALAYAFAALGIANGQKVGWVVGVVVSIGALIIPAVAWMRGLTFGGGYLLTVMFNVALVVVLLHPQSREYQRIWFDGSKYSRRPRR